ncbi:hypothetical protein GOBAR_DD21332 [Gossypium barbadense]|nr:hypothetical protein GOBAR_DD21332 [Gossypium barbadense]
MMVTRLLIDGRDALQSALKKLAEKQRQLIVKKQRGGYGGSWKISKMNLFPHKQLPCQLNMFSIKSCHFQTPSQTRCCPELPNPPTRKTTSYVIMTIFDAEGKAWGREGSNGLKSFPGSLELSFIITSCGIANLTVCRMGDARWMPCDYGEQMVLYKVDAS